MKKFFKTSCKIISPLLAFCIIFIGLQYAFLPKHVGDSTTMWAGLGELGNNSIDVLFLGPSQMFCTVDAQRLTEEFNINSYDFGASTQCLESTNYYLREALKTQNPKVVMVELSAVFLNKSDMTDISYSMSYAPMPFSREKWNSLLEVSDGNKKTAIEYSIPLLVYHSRWNVVSLDDITYYFKKHDYSARGFLARKHIQKLSVAYNQAYDGDIQEIPKDSVNAILSIAEICRENNIELVFFKAPVSDWTRNDSAVVKRFLNENNLNYLEMNDYLDEIGIDDDKHLNVTGAEKSTDFIAEYLLKSFNNIA